MAAIVGPRGPSMTTKFAIDGPGGPVVAGDHLRRDRTIAASCIAKSDPYACCDIASSNGTPIGLKNIDSLIQSIMEYWCCPPNC